MTDRAERLFRLADPDDTRPLPPPGQENFLPGALFGATAAAVVTLAGVHLTTRGFAFALPLVGAAVYLGLLARGAYLVRPRLDAERWCRRLMLFVQVQALFYAASTFYATTAAYRDQPLGRVEAVIFGITVFTAFGGLAASFLLHGVARRARPLVLAQFLGPILMAMGTAGAPLFG